MTADEPLPVGMSMTNRWHATETLQQQQQQQQWRPWKHAVSISSTAAGCGHCGVASSVAVGGI